MTLSDFFAAAERSPAPDNDVAREGGFADDPRPEAGPGSVEMRKFLIILDDSPEMLNAMRYAAIRAAKTGGAVEMLAVISPAEFQHFMGVADVMRAEAHEKIEAHFQIFKDRMEKREGITPTLVVREGDKVDAIIAHIKSDPEIGVLVVGAGVDKSGPGPVISALTGRRMAELRVPITIVPGSMTKEDIIAAT
jgi:nucleotide-binding universal stress UspA family protein